MATRVALLYVYSFGRFIYSNNIEEFRLVKNAQKSFVFFYTINGYYKKISKK